MYAPGGAEVGSTYCPKLFPCTGPATTLPCPSSNETLAVSVVPNAGRNTDSPI